MMMMMMIMPLTLMMLGYFDNAALVFDSSVSRIASRAMGLHFFPGYAMHSAD